MAVTLATDVTLRSGIAMPIFGLGTFLCTEGDCEKAVLQALRNGVRLIDTAQYYENEEAVGAAIDRFCADTGSAKPFVVTKLRWDAHGAENVRPMLMGSLKKLRLSHVDLFLMHSPEGGRCVETWREMLTLRNEGFARAVGVSNFGVEHLEGLRAAGLEAPEVNQIELHPWLQQRDVVEYMLSHQIAVMGYCPLARAKKFGEEGSPVASIAASRGISEAVVCIRWSLERGFITIPKSASQERIQENISAASLGRTLFDAESMEIIAKADCGFCASLAVRSMWKPWGPFK
jgi:diketogulonate reductase-like aldo/keto reductase